MKKKIIALICALAALLALSSCSAPLPEGMEEEAVISTAKELIELLNAGDYESCVDMFNDQTAATLDAQKLEDALGAMLDRLGSFKEYEAQATAGDYDEAVGDFAVAAIVCEYENGKATFTISVDTNGEICGIYMK